MPHLVVDCDSIAIIRHVCVAFERVLRWSFNGVTNACPYLVLRFTLRTTSKKCVLDSYFHRWRSFVWTSHIVSKKRICTIFLSVKDKNPTISSAFDGVEGSAGIKDAFVVSLRAVYRLQPHIVGIGVEVQIE